ncbi:heat-inducible transcriptional repressor HrcA [Aciduricibacillus chroicocephali]|uniref:Heat-inducible transcription repressor HrcA n=1 Tax=Aciduricibacillus chroicocephali TaxID=3054939 RepID=A0ABY9KS50_9BACI|nr:heat-inducible transcriptional repressor HrcA [Bacillaceae bacterium 44XB]
MLTNRQLLILEVIIDDFIKSAKPVGSRAIAKKDNISFSAATIRNEMADLEEMGLLEKTHTSSGRIPSELGYRYYVDHVIGSAIKGGPTVIRDRLQGNFFEMEQIVQMSAHILSDLTSYTAIILGPEMFETKLKQLQLVALTKQTAVAILITNTGHVEHRSFAIPEDMDTSDLEKMVNILNDRLKGEPLYRLPELLQTEVRTLMLQYMDASGRAFEYLKAAFTADQHVKLYFGGKSNMLMQPEFNNAEKVHALYRMLDNETVMANLLKAKTSGIQVSIGHENELEAIKDLSLITATYHLGDEQTGTIALLGPTRMEYRKVMALLHTLSNEMTDALYLWYKSNG